jgi:hypothetical protein
MRFLEEISEYSRLRRIMLQQSWNEDSRTHKSKEDLLHRIRNCATICMKKGIRLEDMDGVAFGDGKLASLLVS